MAPSVKKRHAAKTAIDTHNPHEQKAAPNGGKMCGAKTRQGTPCKKVAMPNGRCRNHGGATPRGLALPQTKVGRYSSSMPARLLARYQQAEDDPDLLSTRAEVAVAQTRIMELQERLYTGESGSLWGAFLKAWAQFKAAAEDDDEARQKELMAELDRIVREGAKGEAAWNELFRAMDRKTKLAAHEWKRLVDLNQLITAERATVWAMGLLDVVLKHVTDPDQRRAIANDYQNRMDATPPVSEEDVNHE